MRCSSPSTDSFVLAAGAATGASHSTSPSTGTPCAAAYRLIEQPDECPHSTARPPATSTTARTASTSRSRSRRPSAVLSPRPSRSGTRTATPCSATARAVATVASPPRSEPAPATTTRAGPSPTGPYRSYATRSPRLLVTKSVMVLLVAVVPPVTAPGPAVIGSGAGSFEPRK